MTFNIYEMPRKPIILTDDQKAALNEVFTSSDKNKRMTTPELVNAGFNRAQIRKYKQKYLKATQQEAPPLGKKFMKNFVGAWYCDMIMNNGDMLQNHPGADKILLFLGANHRYAIYFPAQNSTKEEYGRLFSAFRKKVEKMGMKCVRIYSDQEAGVTALHDPGIHTVNVSARGHRALAIIDNFAHHLRNFHAEYLANKLNDEKTVAKIKAYYTRSTGHRKKRGMRGSLPDYKISDYEWSEFVKYWNQQNVDGLNVTREQMAHNEQLEEALIARNLHYNNVIEENRAVHVVPKQRVEANMTERYHNFSQGNRPDSIRGKITSLDGNYATIALDQPIKNGSQRMYEMTIPLGDIKRTYQENMGPSNEERQRWRAKPMMNIQRNAPDIDYERAITEEKRQQDIRFDMQLPVEPSHVVRENIEAKAEKFHNDHDAAPVMMTRRRAKAMVNKKAAKIVNKVLETATTYRLKGDTVKMLTQLSLAMDDFKAWSQENLDGKPSDKQSRIIEQEYRRLLKKGLVQKIK